MAKFVIGPDGRLTYQGAPPAPGAPAAPGGAPGVAVKVANRGTNGSDPRFSVAGLQRQGNNYVDAAGNVFDDGGRMISGDWSLLQDTPGLPPSNQSESYDVYSPAGQGRNTGGFGGGGGGGVGAGMTSSDPYFNQIKSMLQAQSAGDAANTKAMLQKLLIGFGMIPEGFQDKLGVLDDLTRSLIAKNTESGISQYARMLEAKGDNTKALIGRLSRSGLRRSGAKGAKLRKGQLDYDRLLSDSLNELLGQIGGAYSGYTSNENARQMQLLSALQNSQGNYWSGAGSSQQSWSNPYLVTAAQRGSIDNGGTQYSLANFVDSGRTAGAVTAPTPVYGSGGRGNLAQ